MATSTFDAAAEAKFRNNVAEYNKTAAPEDRHSEADIEQEVNNRRMATAIPGASTIPANTAAEISAGIDAALPATTAVPSPAAPLPATAASQPASSAVAGSPFGFDNEEIKKKLLAYGWVPPAAYGAYELGKKALPSAQQLWGNLSQKMTGSPDVPAPQIEPILDAAPTQSNMDKMRATLKMAPRPEVQTVQDIAEKLTPDQIRQQKMDIATKAAQQQMAASAVPGGFAPVNATPAPVTPSVVETITPPIQAAITADPVATPAEKAQALVHAPEAAPVAATPVEGTAVPRITKNVLAFPDVPAPVIPPGTPANARRTAEQIAVLKAEDPLNKGYNQVSRAAGITAETPAPEARSFMDRVTNEVFGGKPPASQGGAAPQAKQITNFIETNQKDFPNIYSKLKEIQAKYPAQSGSAHLGMLAGIAGLGLGALGAYGAYKEGKQTGDWTNLGLLGGSLLAMSAPSQAAYQAATYSKSLGETPEELKAFGQMLKNSQQAFKVGAGRGVAPPSSYNR